jgi:hypothetical protein
MGKLSRPKSTCLWYRPGSLPSHQLLLIFGSHCQNLLDGRLVGHPFGHTPKLFDFGKKARMISIYLIRKLSHEGYLKKASFVGGPVTDVKYKSTHKGGRSLRELPGLGYRDMRDLGQVPAHVHDAEIEICEGDGPPPRHEQLAS